MAATKKKRLLITKEVDWYQTQIDEFIKYISDIDLGTIEDRVVNKPTKSGGLVSQIVTTEEQASHKMRMLNDIPKLLAELNELKTLAEDDKKDKRKGFEGEDVLDDN